MRQVHFNSSLVINDYIHINQSNVSRIIKRVTLQLGLLG
jgi:hypothetical protein